MTSTNELGNENNFFAFPNPFRDILHLRVPEQITGDCEWEVCDSRGKIFRQFKTSMAGEVSIQTSEWPSGLYFLRVKYELGRSAYKVIKQ